MKKILILLIVLSLFISLCACDEIKGDKNESESKGEDTADVIFEASDKDMFTDRDGRDNYDASSAVRIELCGDSVKCNSKKVTVSGTTVTITDEGTYIVSGTLDDGMLIVNAEETDKPQIVLEGVSITSSSSAALYIIEADKVFVTLSEGSENYFSNGGVFEEIDENNIDGAIFSKQDLTFNGLGSLTVTSPADHGIVCKDDLVFTSGSYTVSSASHGLDANDSVRIADAMLTVDAGKDGIHCENSDDATLGFFYMSSGYIKIEAEGDGISAEAYAQFEGGDIYILAGGGSENGTKQSSGGYGGFMGGRPWSSSSSSESDDGTSMKGIKTTGNLLFSSGSFNINSADDAIHSNTSITINGGSFEIASGDDALHADEALTINDCNINITESYEGLEALDVKVAGGNIRLVASDDGINAAGGTDSSGTGGRDNGMFGGGHGMGGGMGGMSSSSNGSIVISGGELYINSSGDGMDANGTLEITGGYTVVVGPTQGDTATLDYDVSGVISGGTFIGTGSSMMAQTFSDSQNQGVIALSVGNQSAETEIILTDENGNIVIRHTPELSFAVVILSSPDIIKGESYTITIGSASGTFEAS